MKITDLDNLIKVAIKRLHIRYDLSDDARQECYLAVLQGEDIYEHLKKWKKEENNYKYKHKRAEKELKNASESGLKAG